MINQTGDITCELNIYHLLFLLQNYHRKETKVDWLKLDSNICDTDIKIQIFLKLAFNYHLLISEFEESRSSTLLKQNGSTDLLWDQDKHTMFTKRECMGIVF